MAASERDQNIYVFLDKGKTCRKLVSIVYILLYGISRDEHCHPTNTILCTEQIRVNPTKELFFRKDA